MELKDFVKKVLLDLDTAITQANNEAGREMRFKGVKETRTAVEFDVAVTVENDVAGSANGGIKVLGIAQIGADVDTISRHSMVSRVSFGVDVSYLTKQEMTKNSDLEIYP